MEVTFYLGALVMQLMLSTAIGVLLVDIKPTHIWYLDRRNLSQSRYTYVTMRFCLHLVNQPKLFYQ